MYTDGDFETTIEFVSLEPIFDDIAETLTVYGTDGDNAIDYRAGSTPAHGVVSVDGFELVEFTNKSVLTLAGKAGTDRINLNNPNVPAGLQQIVVVGDNPNDDQLILNGTEGSDTLTFTPDTATFGTAQINALPVTFDLIESVTINGQGGDDGLEVKVDASIVDLFPGTMDDAGTVQVDSLVPLHFEQLGADGGVTITEVGAPGYSDLVYHGTTADDYFRVPHKKDVITPSIGLGKRVPVSTTGIRDYTLRGLEGHDQFDVTSEPEFATRLSINVEAGGPDDADSLSFSSDPSRTTYLTFTYAKVSDTKSNEPGATVEYSGVEFLSVGGDIVVRSGTGGRRSHFEVTPETKYAARLQWNDSAPIVNYSGYALTIRGPTAWTQDELTVDATRNDSYTTTIDGPSRVVQVGGLVPVHYDYINELNIRGGNRGDRFEVVQGLYSSPTTFIDGGSPIGGEYDSLVYKPTAKSNTTLKSYPGPENDEGSLAYGFGLVSFDHIEKVDVVFQAGELPGLQNIAEVYGSSSNEAFAITAISEQVVEVVSDHSFATTYTGLDKLSLDAGGGDDLISLDLANSLGAVALTVDGGAPGVRGDEMTAYAGDGASWSPGGPREGRVELPGGGQVIYKRIENPMIVTNLPPLANPGGPYTAPEGSSIVLDGSGSSDLSQDANTLTYQWDFDYDGHAFDIDATGATPTFDASRLDGPSQRTVALRVTDSDSLSHTATTTVNIANVAPTAFPGGPYLAINGTVQLVGVGFDPANDLMTFEWDFDFDGQTFDIDATGPTPTFTASGDAQSFAIAIRPSIPMAASAPPYRPP